MAKFIGNLNHILDSNKLLRELRSGHLEDNCMLDNNGELKEECSHDIRLIKLKEAGYPDPICSGRIYTAVHHFPEEYIHKLDEYFGTKCLRALVSEFLPGHLAPPHFDYAREDNEEAEEYLNSLGIIEAYHIHLGEPEEGHAFIVDGHCCYMEEPGNCYQWDHYLSWHRACNTGFTKKYLLSYYGLRTDEPIKGKYKFHKHTEQVDIILEDGRII